MSFLNYRDLNSLADFSFIAGTEYILEYTVYEDDGFTPIDITSMSAVFYASPYGQPELVSITKAGVISGTTTGLFTVTLETADTLGLSGKYVQQPVITDFSGKSYRLAQGVFTIIPKIG